MNVQTSDTSPFPIMASTTCCPSTGARLIVAIGEGRLGRCPIATISAAASSPRAPCRRDTSWVLVGPHHYYTARVDVVDHFLIQFAWDQRPVFHDTKLGLLYLVPFVDLESHERDCDEKKAGPSLSQRFAQ